MENRSLFVISNGSHEFFPKNSLTNFRNKLPTEIDLKDNYEVAVKSLGFSRTFKQMRIPENDFPSFFISKSNLPSYVITPKEEFENIRKLRKDKLISEIDFLSNKDTSDGTLLKTHDTTPFYFKDNESYNSTKLNDYFSKVNRQTGSNIVYQKDRISFKIPQLPDDYDNSPITNSYWIVCHESFIETFNIIPFNHHILKFADFKKYKSLEMPDFSKIVETNHGTDERTFLIFLNTTKVYFKGEKYLAFHIQSPLHELNCLDIERKIFPDLIKIKCGNIKPQILNNSYSKDLVVFCPDFSKDGTFFYHEFDSLQYVPLSNTMLKDIELSICDEKNHFLQLAPGTPTIVKLSFRKMEKNKESFNVRLSSAVSTKFPQNSSASFKVELPNTLNLDRKWKVALTSISHPNNFTTFLCDEDSRSLSVSWRSETKEIFKHKLTLKEHYNSPNDVFNEIKTFFSENNLGEVKLELENRMCFYFPRICNLTMGNYLLRVLGFTHYDALSTAKKYTRFVIQPYTSHSFIKNENGQNLFCFQEKITLNILDPKYICLYANFISPTILGGEYHKILRIIPIRESKTGYIISEFKHREFYELQNTEIKELEIELRAHDGELINFKSKQNIIINLLFSNYIED